MSTLLYYDTAILDFIRDNLKCGFLDVLMPYITAIGNGGILYIILALFLIMFKRTRKYGIMLGAALLFGLIFGNLILKNVIARPRPFSGKEIELLISPPSDWSFPSGHTMASFEMASVVFYMNRKTGYIAILVASLIAFSRLYLYVHFPTDVLGGLLLGTFFGFCAIKLYVFIENKFSLNI